jgi:hypothetical protein
LEAGCRADRERGEASLGGRESGWKREGRGFTWRHGVGLEERGERLHLEAGCRAGRERGEASPAGRESGW